MVAYRIDGEYMKAFLLSYPTYNLGSDSSIVVLAMAQKCPHTKICSMGNGDDELLAHDAASPGTLEILSISTNIRVPLATGPDVIMRPQRYFSFDKPVLPRFLLRNSNTRVAGRTLFRTSR